MKTPLQLITGIVILLFTVLTTNGQSIVLTENFTAFSTGSHATPSTTDASATLDSKTLIPGWTGALIYPAGGEIKLGTSTSAGWIETPALDLSANGGIFSIEFDIARWPSDATTVQVCHNGSPAGSVITPADNFQKIQLSFTMGTSSSRIKIQGLTKRFFIDNFIITSGNVPTGISVDEKAILPVRLFPVPAYNNLTICNIANFELIEVHDYSGKEILRFKNEGAGEITFQVSGMESGFYVIILRSGKDIQYMKFLKI